MHQYHVCCCQKCHPKYQSLHENSKNLSLKKLLHSDMVLSNIKHSTTTEIDIHVSQKQIKRTKHDSNAAYVGKKAHISMQLLSPDDSYFLILHDHIY